MVRPQICNPVIPGTGGAGSGFALQCGEVVWPAWGNQLFILRAGGKKNLLEFKLCTGAKQLLGLWVLLIQWIYPESASNKIKVEVFSEVVLFSSNI